MPIYLLGEDPLFPPPEMASPEGIIAAGGDLSPERLLNAYASGIFPWFSENDPILWWTPDPRMILLPGQIHISKSMKRIMDRNSGPFHLTVDRSFAEVIENCRKPRKIEGKRVTGTWITPEMKAAYTSLHRLGYAHSVEVWQENRLVGGLYGVSLGRCFFGESMFSLVPNASKYAFIVFFRKLFNLDFQLVDCQVPNNHLKRLGATEIPRRSFLALLDKALEHETLPGKWHSLEDTLI